MSLPDAISADPVVLVVEGETPGQPPWPVRDEAGSWRLLRATDTDEALGLAAAHDLAAALLPGRASGAGPTALAVRLRAAERSRRVPIVFVGAAPGTSLPRFEGDDAAPVDRLAEPVDARLLRDKLAVLAELDRQRRDARAAREEVQRLLAHGHRMGRAMTHDLRSPLSVIAMNAELVRLRGRDEVLQQAALRIKGAGAHMGRMIDQVLEFSGLRAAPLRRQPADLLELAAAVVAEIGPGTPDTPVRVHGQGDPNAVVDVDALRRVLANLLNNALQHGGRGLPVTVEVDGREPGQVQVGVHNAGVLPPEVAASPFTPFRSMSSHPATGLGLGLYMVERLVGAHGGTAHITSSEANGTLARFSVPRDAPVDPPGG